MGNPKQKWTSEEEEALRAGVAKHGAGKWKLIQRDPEFNHLLHSRSNIDLKDKWRNLNVYPIGQNSRDKSRAPKVKANPESSVSPVPKAQTPASSIPASNDVAADTIVEDNIKCLLDGKTASKYDAIIYEALSSLKDPSGSDTSTILRFIEQRHDSHEVPPNFSRKVLSSRLRKLVLQEKLEKIENGFRIKKELLRSTKRKESWPIHNQNTCHLGDTVEEAAVAAAYRIAEAENKSFVAAEAVKEAERVSRMAEDSNVMLQLAKEIFEKCENGEIVLMA